MRIFKMVLLLTFVVLSVFLISCSGSDVYQGIWKATDLDGNKLEISFEPKKMTITSSDGSKNYDYTQNSVKIKNSIKTYGIKLGDGRAYSILFPIAGNVDKAVMLIGDNQVLYTMSRNSYITYEELNKLD